MKGLKLVAALLFIGAVGFGSNASTTEIGERDKTQEAQAEGWFPDRAEKLVHMFTSSSAFHWKFEQAVEIVKKGEHLPDRPPN